MNHWTIKRKLWVLTTFLMLNSIGLGVLGLYSVFNLGSHVENLAQVQVPSVRKMTLADLVLKLDIV